MSRAAVDFWANQAKKYPLLPEEVTLDLARQIQSAPEGSIKKKKLVNKLCIHNLRLVIKLVSCYSKRKVGSLQRTDTQLVDLLQQGFFGLKRAVELYDPTLGYKFSTYAHRWILQAVSRYQTDDRVIRVPENVCRELNFRLKTGNYRESATQYLINNMHQTEKVLLISSANKRANLEDSHETEVLDLCSTTDNLTHEETGVFTYDERIDALLDKSKMKEKDKEFFNDFRSTGFYDCKKNELTPEQRKDRNKFERLVRLLQSEVVGSSVD